MKKYDEAYVRNSVSELKSLNGSRIEKYERNYKYYNNTPKVGLSSIKDPMVVGYYQADPTLEEDTSITPSINIIKSCIDTLASKISQSKVRPFFNCIDGSFKDIQVCRQSQQFFDQYFEIEEVNKKVSMAFRDACVFEKGVIYIDDINRCITRALPWQVYIRPSEITYNNITRIYYEQAEYPVTLLPKDLRAKLNPETQYVTYGIYYDTDAKIRAQYVTGEDKMLIEDYEGNRIPFIFLWYSNPILGSSALSVVDMLYSIQREINIIMDKIKDASQLNPALTFFVPESSNIKSQQLNNRTGNVVQYRVTPDMPSQPVTVATPSFIDSQYTQLIDNLVQKAYELVGISQLSAQSKKPSGVDSGIGLQTLQDVESERFQTQLDQVIRCYVDIAKTCLRVFPKDEDILPDTQARVNIKWKDVVEEEKKMSIQFSAADSLSKDPSIKLQQLQQLAQAGIIPQSRIAQFMQLPDLEGGYSLSNNAINAVLTVIDECLENDKFDVPPFIPFAMLKEEIINTQLSLRAANYEKNKEDIDKLSTLYEKIEDIEYDTQRKAAEENAKQQAKLAIDQQKVQKEIDAMMQRANPQPPMSPVPPMPPMSPAGPGMPPVPPTGQPPMSPEAANPLAGIVAQQAGAPIGVPNVVPGDLDINSPSGQGVTGWDHRPYTLSENGGM